MCTESVKFVKSFVLEAVLEIKLEIKSNTCVAWVDSQPIDQRPISQIYMKEATFHNIITFFM
jgi:hypothetical protein